MKRCLIIVIQLFMCLHLFSSEKIIPYTLNNKIGFLDEELTIIIPPQYEGEVANYTNTMLLLYCKHYSVLIGSNGKQLHRGVDRMFILGDEKYAVSQRDGDEFIRVYSSEGKQIHFYDKIRAYNSDNNGNIFIDDYNYDSGSRLNILNKNGELLYKKNTFKRIFGYNSELKIAFVQNNDFSDCLVDEFGNSINKSSFQFGMRSFNEGFIFGKNLETGEVGYYDMNCNLIIKAGIRDGTTIEDWSYYPSVKCGVVALVNDGSKNILLIEKQTLHSDNWSIVDVNGKFLAYGITADYISPFSDDVAVYILRNGDKWIYRLINKYGNFITNTDYDEIQSSINGYCMAKKNGIDYLISSSDGTAYKCSDFK